MLNVTSRAKVELHGMLMRALAEQPGGSPDELGFRLVAQSGEGEGVQLGLVLDAPRQGDEVVEHDGRSVMIVDTPVSDLLADLTLDVEETAEGTALSIRK